MGEYGGRAGEPTGPRGVGGINAIAGKTSVGTPSSEGGDLIVSNFSRLVVRLRALTGWKCRCCGSSTPEIRDMSLTEFLTFSWFPFDSFKGEPVSWVDLVIV